MRTLGMARIIQTLLDFVRRFFGGRREEAPPLPEERPTVPEPAEVEDSPPPVVPIPREEPPMSRPLLSRGATDRGAVRELQALLLANGERVAVDGDFGPGTEKAVREVQLSYGMADSGVVDAATWKLFDRPPYNADPTYDTVPLPPQSRVSGTSGVSKAWNGYGNLLSMLGADMGIPPAVACAVLAVESAGDGFWNGRMVIRFENHIFQRYWGKVNPERFAQHFQMDSGERWKGHAWRPDAGAWRPLHTNTAGQDAEWAVLDFARQLDDTAALMSISMGAPQVMGFNHAKVGYKTVQEMFAAFAADERAHVLGLFDFIRSDHRMVRSLRLGDWHGFAHIYNGSGQASHYGGLIGTKVGDAKMLGIL